MATLAIKGHATRGSEVIGLLEMLGGENQLEWSGSNGKLIYLIRDGIIHACHADKVKLYEFSLFCLEDFVHKFPYKIGDKVNVCGENVASVIGMRWESDYVVYRVRLEKNDYETSKMIEELQPYTEQKEESMKERKEDSTVYDKLDFTKEPSADKVELILGDYEIKEEDGKTYLVKKKLHPKTYEECCEVLGKTKAYQSVSGYKTELLEDFQQLLICRDAYWKMAGNWKPDWEPLAMKFIITMSENCLICEEYDDSYNSILAFPTEEMRDTFYENFKGLIEECKELL